MRPPPNKVSGERRPPYQAFNERVETLNSIPRQGDNFYASIMHALPDDTRVAIDLPNVGQSGELQRNSLITPLSIAVKSPAL